MTNQQWNNLVKIANGERVEGHPIGLIIDCPWLPKWYGISILDYFTNDDLWLKANLKAIETFPEVTFLPGFWSEYGMCTEPSAFGAKCIFWRDEFPFADKIINDPAQIYDLKAPNPETDGLLPFMLNRLRLAKPTIEAAGYNIKFSVSRGPMNIASFLMGTTELMTTMMMDPDAVHHLLRVITNFLKEWHRIQREAIPSIEGILMLDDIVGFVGEDEFLEFGFPYFKELYNVDAKVKMFHNDADCTMSIHHYPNLGINLYNPGTHMPINEMIKASQHRMTILGNIPPRDILAAGSPDDVRMAVKSLIATIEDHSRVMLSCGGGMPPGVPSKNVAALIEAAKGN